MINIGIIGVGGIASVHLSTHRRVSSANVIALCDKIPERAAGRGNVTINIGGGDAQPIDAKAYTDYRDLLADPAVEVVDICLPTYLHARVAIAALEAGKHVLCEKPMAMTVAECDQVIAAAKAANRSLMIAHCIRFWPEYAVLKEMIDGGQYGRVITAAFTRLSPLPTWSSENWLLDPARSGGAIQDLHVHDIDYIAYVWGMPEQVEATGVADTFGISQVNTRYRYGNDAIITAEGGWNYPAKFPFRMEYLVRMEKATVEFAATRGGMVVYPEDGEAFTPALPEGDGYSREIEYFLACIEQGKRPDVVTPLDARESVRILEAERESVLTGKPVTLAAAVH